MTDSDSLFIFTRWRAICYSFSQRRCIIALYRIVSSTVYNESDTGCTKFRTPNEGTLIRRTRLNNLTGTPSQHVCDSALTERPRARKLFISVRSIMRTAMLRTPLNARPLTVSAKSITSCPNPYFRPNAVMRFADGTPRLYLSDEDDADLSNQSTRAHINKTLMSGLRARTYASFSALVVASCGVFLLVHDDLKGGQYFNRGDNVLTTTRQAIHQWWANTNAPAKAG